MKGVTAALLVSLAINIALFSFMAGRMAGGAPLRPGGPAGPGAFFDRATPETRALLRDAFIDRRNDARPPRLETAKRRLELRDAILAEPFDRARVEAAYAAFRASEFDMHKVNGAIVMDVLAKLPLDERKALVNALAAPDGDRHAFRPGARRDRAPPTEPADPEN